MDPFERAPRRLSYSRARAGFAGESGSDPIATSPTNERDKPKVDSNGLAEIQRKFSNRFKSMESLQQFSDIKIIVGTGEKSKEFLAHKVVLYTACRFFAGIFESKMKEALDGKITFPDWDPADFDVIMDWIYGVDTTGLTNENLGNVWAIADFLLLEDFQDACVEFVHDHKSDSVAESLKLINSTCDIKRLAVASCESVIQYARRNDWIRPGLSYANCPPKVLRLIIPLLRSISLQETELLEIVCQWIDTLPTEVARTEVVENALALVSLVDRTTSDLAYYAASSKVLHLSALLQCFESSVLESHLDVEKAKKICAKFESKERESFIDTHETNLVGSFNCHVDFRLKLENGAIMISVNLFCEPTSTIEKWSQEFVVFYCLASKVNKRWNQMRKRFTTDKGCVLEEVKASDVLASDPKIVSGRNSLSCLICIFPVGVTEAQLL